MNQVSAMNYVALGAAIVLSSIAAYFSILGLAAIFAASATAVMVMATALEATKVITAAWLHIHWKQLSKAIKFYLILSTITLMAITSMGIFGFLSKAHIEYQTKIETTVGQDIKLVDIKIASKQAELETIEHKLKQIDGMNDKVVGLATRSSDARRAVKTVRDGEKARETLAADKDTKLAELSVLQAEKIKHQSQLTSLEMEVGPLKYIADRLSNSGHADKNTLETAVFWLILIIVVCFDPLAIVLLLGTNIRFKDNQPLPIPTTSFSLLPKPVDTSPERVRRRVVKKVEWGKEHQKPEPQANLTARVVKRLKRTKKGFVRVPDNSIIKL